MEAGMAKKTLPTPEELHKFLRYDPGTGLLYWRHRADRAAKWNTRYAGTLALNNTSTYGYRTGCINKIAVRAHRVVWAMVHGKWPEKEIDHINGNRADNRIENLRLVSAKENRKNAQIYNSNTSGVTGVHKIIRNGNWNGCWRAVINIDGKQVFIGNFANKKDAIFARKQAERKYGFHPNHGRAVTGN
jgi:hypothetical protein